MRFRPSTLALAVVVAGSLACGTAWAGGRGHFHGHSGHGHAHVGVFIGAPLVPWYYGGWGYAYPWPYYDPPVVAVPSSPPVYIERGDEETTTEEVPGYWYYCAERKAYYPYVKECPSPWQKVPAQPPQS